MVIHTFSFLKKVYIFLKFWLVSTFSFSWKHFFTRYNNSLKIESYKLIYFYILSIAALSGASHLCWRAFRLWKMFTRICQWILASLDGLFWKSIVSHKYWLGAFWENRLFSFHVFKAIQGQKWLFLLFLTSKWWLGSKSFRSENWWLLMSVDVNWFLILISQWLSIVIKRNLLRLLSVFCLLSFLEGRFVF